MKRAPRDTRGRRGSAIVEFAVCLPLATYLLLAAADFGRFYIEVARVEATAHSQARRAAVAPSRADSFAECPGQPAAPVAAEPCPDGSPRRVYVRAAAERPFELLGRYPGVPARTTIRRQASLRVR